MAGFNPDGYSHNFTFYSNTCLNQSNYDNDNNG